MQIYINMNIGVRAYDCVACVHMCVNIAGE